MTYSEKLKDPRWQKKRLEILNRDDFTCTMCGDKATTLHIHHLEYVGEPWDCPNGSLKTLCQDCHLIAEWREKENMTPMLFSLKSSNRNPTTVLTTSITHLEVLESYCIQDGSISQWNYINIAGIRKFLEKLENFGKESGSTDLL